MEDIIKILKDLKHSFIINQEYDMATNARKIIKHLELKKFKE